MSVKAKLFVIQQGIISGLRNILRNCFDTYLTRRLIYTANIIIN
jgi:hypothetical protein